jgi:glycosyltransferase involved in cell wall biosynthesis
MKLCWLTHRWFPHGGADTEVIIHTAAALGQAGIDVEVVSPWMWRKHATLDEVCEYYGVQPTFKLTRIAGSPPLAHWTRAEVLAHGCLAAPIHAATRRADVVHTRDPPSLLAAHLARLPWSFETYRSHATEKPWLSRLTRRCRLDRGLGAVAHSQGARQDLIRLGFAPEAVLLARAGCHPSQFRPASDPAEARRALGLELPGPVVMYTGNVSRSKGLDSLLLAARQLPEVDFLVVGGAPQESTRLRAKAAEWKTPRVHVIDRRPAAEVPHLLSAADALIIPRLPFAEEHERKQWSARWPLAYVPAIPLKVYGYLAAGRPLIASDQPQLRELLRDGENAVLVPPDDGVATAQAIRRVLNDCAFGARLAARACLEARQYTWEARGRLMLDFFEARLTARRGPTMSIPMPRVISASADRRSRAA